MRRRRPGLRWGAWCGALALAGWWALGCQPETRYRTLSFFFDGVPDPNAPPEGTARPGQRRTPLIAVARGPAPPVPPPIVSVHQPVVERRCRECHDVERTMEPTALDAALCDKCHYEQRVREGWAHGPINLGTCIPCHRAHESIYPHLLERPVPALCLVCHEEDMAREASYHQGPDVDRCTLCHDPHRMY